MENKNIEEVKVDELPEVPKGKAGDKEYMKNYMRDYIKNSEKMTCECGGKFKSYNKCLHKKTQKHLKWLEMNEQNKPENEIVRLKEELSILKRILVNKLN
jgi:hypothetical protein